MKTDIKQRLIKILEEAGSRGYTQRELMYILGVSKGYLSLIISQLEKNGVVVRYKGPGRTVIVKLTKYTHPSTGRYVRFGIVKSSEYVFLPILLKKLRDRGFETELVFYPNVRELATSLLQGRLHMAMLPIYTQLAYRFFGAPIKGIPGGAVGGGFIVYRGKEIKELIDSYDKISVYSSQISTMEILSHALMRRMRGRYEIRFYRDPRELVEEERDKGDIIMSTWEPYATYLREKGFRTSPYKELLGEYHCCTLAIHENLMTGLRDLVKTLYSEALQEVSRKFDDAIDQYSRMINVEKDLLKKTSRDYSYRDYLDTNEIERLIREGGGYMVSTEILRELIEE
jgi:predicted transcriptional regulator